MYIHTYIQIKHRRTERKQCTHQHTHTNTHRQLRTRVAEPERRRTFVRRGFLAPATYIGKALCRICSAVAAVVVVVLAFAKLTLFLLTILTYVNALVVSAKPRNVFLLLRQVLLAIHVTYHRRHFVILFLKDGFFSYVL